MTTGFRNGAGVDLDDIFQAYSSGAKAGATGFRTSGGQDMADRFQSYSSGTKAALTGFRNAAGTDLRDLFQATGSGAVAANPGYAQLSATYSTTGVAGAKQATAKMTLNPDGTWTRDGSTTGGLVPTITGNWYSPTTAGAGSAYEVRFTLTTTHASTSPSTITNNASTWTSLSAARAFSLQVSTSNSILSDDLYQGSLLIEIRRASDAVVVSSQSVNVQVGFFKQ